MDYGSNYVWMYDTSDEETVSDTELQEAMWLSDEEPPEIPADHQNQVSDELLSSTTKFQNFRPETSPSPVPAPPLPPPAATPTSPQQQPPDSVPKGTGTGAGAGATGTGTGASADSSTKTLEAVETLVVPPSPPSGDKLNYVELKYDTVASQPSPRRPIPAPPLPPPPVQRRYTSVNSGAQGVEYAEVLPQQPRAVTVPAPPPPPVPPARGIIKNRLGSELKRQKRNRVRWQEKSAHEERSQAGVRTRRADTNVLCVKFNKLTESGHVHTGDAVVCQNAECTAILSYLSKTEDKAGGQIWTCEYCGTENDIGPLDPEEVPKEKDTTFLVSPAPVGAAGAAGVGAPTSQDSIVIFCIDVSGSMCVTTEVPGKFKLKGYERLQSLSSFNARGEDQYFPRQRRDVTYVSRLQSVQAAVDQQLTELARNNPTQRVALITFGDEVSVIGDGCGEVVTVAGDRLWDTDALNKVGSESVLPSAVKDTYKSLGKKVFSLEEGGQTALGPSLLLSISMASRVPGSSVVVCTDGLANRGVGSFDDADVRDDEDFAATEAFYDDLGTLALEKGVTVSLITIKGTDCRTAELGQVADTTGGQCIIVDPLTITKEFGSILANPVIATDVMTKIILHHQLYFRTEESQDSVLTIPVGNVTAETELSYDYGVRRAKKKKTTAATPSSATESAGGRGAEAAAKEQKVPELLVGGKPHLPFQLQFRYTSLDGSKLIRVITEAKPTTKDRKMAEKDIKMAVLGSHVAHTTAKMAMEGEYTHARMNAIGMQRLMQRNSDISAGHRAVYAGTMSDLIPLANRLQQRQQYEHASSGRQLSDDEDEETKYHVSPSVIVGSRMATKKIAPKPRKRKAISRRKEMDDDLATYCYQMKSTSSAQYSKSAIDSDDDEEGQ